VGDVEVGVVDVCCEVEFEVVESVVVEVVVGKYQLPAPPRPEVLCSSLIEVFVVVVVVVLGIDEVEADVELEVVIHNDCFGVDCAGNDDLA